MIKLLVLLLSLLVGTFAATNDTSPARWMEQSAKYIADKRMTQIIIPGSHDSATNNLDIHDGLGPGTEVAQWIREFTKFPFVGEIVNIWSKAQGRGILEQLNDGIRYLDVRFCSQGDKIRTCHGLFGTDLEQVVSEFAQFVKENPKEIIVVDVQHLSGFLPEHHKRVLDLFESRLGSKLVLNSRGVDSFVKDLWRVEESVFLLYSVNASTRPLIKDRPRVYERDSMIISNWADKPYPKEVVDFLDSDPAEGIDNRGKHLGLLWVSQGITTPNKEYITKLYEKLLKPVAAGCPSDKPDKDLDLCYPRCKDGFHGVAFTCWNNKPTYSRGMGTLPSHDGNCPDSKPEKDDGLCYKKCDPGYKGVGPLCWADELHYSRGAGVFPKECPPTHIPITGVCWIDPAHLDRPDPNNPNSLEAMAMVTNPQIINWAVKAKGRGALLNIVMVDFYQHGDTPRRVWSLNF